MTDVTKFKSPAKREVVKFLYATAGSDEKEYVFLAKGDKSFAEDFVHRMRVELSRLRKTNANQGRTNRPFKILLKKLEEMSDGTTKVTLLKTMKNQEVFDQVSDLFDLLGTGGRIDG